MGLVHQLHRMGFYTEVPMLENKGSVHDFNVDNLSYVQNQNSYKIYLNKARMFGFVDDSAAIKYMSNEIYVATVRELSSNVVTVEPTLFRETIDLHIYKMHNRVFLIEDKENLQTSEKLIYHPEYHMWEVVGESIYFVQVRVTDKITVARNFYPEAWHSYSLFDHPKDLLMVTHSAIHCDENSPARVSPFYPFVWLRKQPKFTSPKDVIDYLVYVAQNQDNTKRKDVFIKRALCLNSTQ